jgi:PAS domain-containing protein
MASLQTAYNGSQFLRTVFDTVPSPTFIVDEDIQILDYNKAAGQLLRPEPELACSAEVAMSSIGARSPHVCQFPCV